MKRQKKERRTRKNEINLDRLRHIRVNRCGPFAVRFNRIRKCVTRFVTKKRKTQPESFRIYQSLGPPSSSWPKLIALVDMNGAEATHSDFHHNLRIESKLTRLIACDEDDSFSDDSKRRLLETHPQCHSANHQRVSPNSTPIQFQSRDHFHCPAHWAIGQSFVRSSTIVSFEH